MVRPNIAPLAVGVLLLLAAAFQALPRPLQADPDGGEAPKMDALLERARAFEDAGRPEEAVDVYRQAEFLDFGDLRPRLGLARAYLELGNLGEASDSLRTVLIEDPKNPEAQDLQGQIFYRSEMLEDARQAWLRSLAMREDPRVRGELERVERELRTTNGYQDTYSPNFILRYAGDQRSPAERQIRALLEQEYQRLKRIFAGAPENEIIVVLYPDEDFHEATLAPQRVIGLYDGKVRLPFRRIDPDDERFRAVLVHELAHAFIHAMGGEDVPRWLHEGLAQYIEGASAEAQEPEFARLYRSERGGDWGRVFSYPLALSFVNDLVERQGMAGILDLLAHLRRKETLDDALVAVYGRNYDELADDWGRDLARRYH